MTGQKLTGRLLAAGRALAGIGSEDLARAAGAPVDTVQYLEANGAAWVPEEHAEALRAALEPYGIILVPEGGGMGAGVRLKFTRQDTRQIGRLENEGGVARPDDVP